MPTLSTPELTKLSHTLARALSVDEVNQLGRETGQAERLRTVTRHMLARLIEQLRIQTLTPAGHQAVGRFTDIVIHDGSSCALKPTLASAFPGRFTAVTPAAVEVHATFSGFADEASRVQIAPDARAAACAHRCVAAWPLCWPTPDAPTATAIDAPDDYERDWASWRSLK